MTLYRLDSDPAVMSQKKVRVEGSKTFQNLSFDALHALETFFQLGCAHLQKKLKKRTGFLVKGRYYAKNEENLFYRKLAIAANFVLPENVSLANDYTMLQKA